VQRLTASQLKPVRLKLAKQQGGICPITKRPMGVDIVLDHCHKNGQVRAVLGRWVNACLGKVENWAGRVGGGVDPVEFLRGVADYIEVHRTTPSGTFYPTFRTEEEKRDLRNKKARLARRKANTTQGAE
jgi:hypothetical protein